MRIYNRFINQYPDMQHLMFLCHAFIEHFMPRFFLSLIGVEVLPPTAWSRILEINRRNISGENWHHAWRN